MKKIMAIGIVGAVVCFVVISSAIGYQTGYSAGKTKFEKPQLEGIRFLLNNFTEITDFEFLYRTDGTLAGVRITYDNQLIYDDMDNDLFIDWNDLEGR